MFDKMKKTISDVVGKWHWIPLLLGRILISFIFVRTGLDRLHDLSQSKDVLNFFGIAVPVGHRWDAVFPLVEFVCGGFMLLGLLTRLTAALLMGTIMAAFLNNKFNELSGLNLSGAQGAGLIVSLLGLCAAGAGSMSFDRFIFQAQRIFSSPP